MGKSNTNMRRNSLFSKEQIIQILKLSRKKDIFLSIKNKNNNEYGVSTYTKDGKVAVFEGEENGKDDKVYSINYFIKNYTLMTDSINFKQLKNIEELEK